MRFRYAVSYFICSLLFTLNHTAGARELRSLHDFSASKILSSEEGSVRVVIKFLDDSGLRAVDDEVAFVPELQNSERFDRYMISAQELRASVVDINDLIARRRLVAEPLIDDSEIGLAEARAVAEAYWGHEVAELATYAQLVLRDGGFSEVYSDLVSRLNEIPTVEVAYLEPIALPPSGFQQALESGKLSCSGLNPPADLGDYFSSQGYWGPPPVGLNVSTIQIVGGSAGHKVRVIDIEGGMYPHFEIPQLFMKTGKTYDQYANHGTSVLGIIAGKDDGLGIRGLVPAAKVGLRSIFSAQYTTWADANKDSFNVSSNIYWAAKQAQNGVVLIELQRSGPEEIDCECGQCTNLPVEYWPAEFDAIQTAVGNGVTVIEPAGNGGRSLDHPMLGGAFDRKYRDSGAVLVTGSKSDGVTPQCYHGSPNYGKRVDVHSWGENVATSSSSKTTLYNDKYGHCFDYSDKFNGSSSASAIIAGAAAALHGVHRNMFDQQPFDPVLLRKMLQGYGTKQAPGTEDHWIGIQPDLWKIILQMAYW